MNFKNWFKIIGVTLFRIRSVWPFEAVRLKIKTWSALYFLSKDLYIPEAAFNYHALPKAP